MIRVKGIEALGKPVFRRKSLYEEYKQFTDGHHYWRDDYLLERWANSERPVVSHGQVFHGFQLLRSNFVTVKFIGQSKDAEVKRELKINKFLREQCQSDYVSTIEESFTIPHHLQEIHPQYRDISFDAIVYPPTGSDFERIVNGLYFRKNPMLPLSIEMRVKCIEDIIRGVAQLHNLGIVHADIHPGNVGLPAPSVEDIELLLKEPLVEDKVERRFGSGETVFTGLHKSS
ncbi:hypothetical protein E4U55_000060 [Claviceps digitariae]|nr:hypothetical protein E4U55_000060 [Claviceps digitariae]